MHHPFFQVPISFRTGDFVDLAKDRSLDVSDCLLEFLEGNRFLDRHDFLYTDSPVQLVATAMDFFVNSRAAFISGRYRIQLENVSKFGGSLAIISAEVRSLLETGSQKPTRCPLNIFHDE